MLNNIIAPPARLVGPAGLAGFAAGVCFSVRLPVFLRPAARVSAAGLVVFFPCLL